MDKSNLSLIINYSILFLTFPRKLTGTYLEAQVNTTSEVYCELNAIPLRYEINIGPVYNSSDPVHVLAWTKIIMEISESNCSSNFRNTGHVNTPRLKLNARNCKIDTKKVNLTNLVNGENIQITFVDHLLENQTVNESINDELFIILNKKLSLGDHVLLYIPYKIELTREYTEKSWQGLYFYDPKGINTTNFWELYSYYPFHSKYMFPVIDNFDHVRKPTFKISVAKPSSEEFISVSNSDIVDVREIAELGNGWVMVNFRETPPMKVDQVAVMILGNFQIQTIQSNDALVNRNYTLNLWTLMNNTFAKDSTILTSQEIQKLFDFYRKKFVLTGYPLNKLDIVALPWTIEPMDSFSNLGIVMSPDYKVLLDKGDLEENANSMRRISRFLAFQITQQWFYEPISSVLKQLPEGLDENTWIAGRGLIHYIANWPMVELYQEGVRIGHNIHYWNENDLLVMMESVFSPTIMQSAINEFKLPKTLNNGAFSTDLYDAIQKAIEFHNMTHVLPSEGNVTIADLFQSWIINKYNWPTIKFSEVLNDTNSIQIYQECTALEGTLQFWWVPIKILTKESESVLWLSPNNTSVNTSKIWTIPNRIVTSTDWIVVNPDGKAYYNIEYSARLLSNLVSQLQLNHSVFSPDERNYIIQIQFNLMNFDKWETIWGALELSRYLGNEMEYRVWCTVTEYMSKYNICSFTKYLGSKINTVLGKIGMEPKSQEDINVTNLRQLFMRICSMTKIPLCLQYGRKLMTKWMNNSTVNPFKSELYPRKLYCTVLQNESDDPTEHSTFNFLLNQLVNTDNLEGPDKGNFLQLCGPLACVKNVDLLKELLGNNSRLLEHKILLECYKNTLPDEILLNHPVLMKQAVYDFWIRLTLEGNMLPASLLRRFWQLITGFQNDSPEFVENILKFLNDHKGIFDKDLLGSVDLFKNEVIKRIYPENYWRDSTKRMNEWIEKNI